MAARHKPTGSLAGPPVQEKDADDVSPQPTPSSSVHVEAPTHSRAAWLSVAGTFLLFSITWGPTLSFGVFQSYYATNTLAQHSASAISWIGGLCNLLVVCSGLWSGPLFDRGHLHALAVAGVALSVLGFMLLSLCSAYWQILLAQGLVFGAGAGLLQIPLYSSLSVQFGPALRPVAVGIAACGASVGGVVFPLALSRLFARVGFAWACRTVGFVQLGVGIVGCALVLQVPAAAGVPKRALAWGALREPTFAAYCVVVFCLFLAYWIPLFYTTDYAIYRLGASEQRGFELIAIINGASALGRLAPAFVIVRLGALTVLYACSLAAAVLLFAWIAVASVPAYIAWCVLLGFATGSLISATPVANVHPILSPDRSEIGARLGILWCFSGIGGLVGNPIAGALATPLQGDFVRAQVFAGCIMLGGVAVMTYPMLKCWRYDRREARRRRGETLE